MSLALSEKKIKEALKAGLPQYVAAPFNIAPPEEFMAQKTVFSIAGTVSETYSLKLPDKGDYVINLRRNIVSSGGKLKTSEELEREIAEMKRGT